MENGESADNTLTETGSQSTKVPHRLENDANWLVHAKRLILDKEKSEGTIAILETKLSTLQHEYSVHKTPSEATIQQLRQELHESKNAQSGLETRCSTLQKEKSELMVKHERFEKLRTEFARMSREMQQLLGEGGVAGSASAASAKCTKSTNTVSEMTPPSVPVVPLNGPGTGRKRTVRSASLEGVVVSDTDSKRKPSEGRNVADKCGCFVSELQTSGRRCPLHALGRYVCTLCPCVQSFPDRASWEEHERTHESKGYALRPTGQVVYTSLTLEQLLRNC